MSIHHVQFTKDSGLDPIGIDADFYRCNEDDDGFISFYLDNPDDEDKDFCIASFNMNIVASVISEAGKSHIKYGSLCLL